MINYNIEGSVNVFNDFDVSALIGEIVNKIEEIHNINSKHYVSFIIINNEEIHNINKTYRKIDRPTDVITFANIDSMEDDSLPAELGDIFISYEKVIEQANEYNHSIKREFAFLVTHGMLHILGYDHMIKEEEIEMFSMQDRILDELKIYR